MEQNMQALQYLQKKAALLPKTPGVYIMEDKDGKVIYVGKSRALKNRVSQYFHGAHDIKTSRMVSHVRDFRYITCDTEMESLVLENNLIKQYTPKYNILLKDAKSYPYIKVTTEEEYPRIVMTRKRGEKGLYFGPYSNTKVIGNVISTIEKTLGIPSCKKKFPDDIGKGRPCVYRQIGRCCGVCTGQVSAQEYRELIKCAVQLLRGNTKEVETALSARMARAAEQERFEEAARCRDAIAALGRLGDRQKTQLSPDTDCDVLALSSHEGCDCAAALYIRGGAICDSEYFMFGADEITGAQTYSEEETFPENAQEDSPFAAFIVNLYRYREYIPKEIYLSFSLTESDREITETYLSQRAGRKIQIRTPVRGIPRDLCKMAQRDAVRHSVTRRRKDDTDEKLLASLASLLHLEVLPQKIEAYDISNMGSENITAGMIVVENAKFCKKHYRHFKIKGNDGPDDYQAMEEALRRRLSHVGESDDESFGVLPDLILLDGGAGHVSVIRQLLRSLGIAVPVFGMVKDEHHKTRTIVSEDGEVSIAREPEVFRFVYRIQEEVHRYTISRMSAAKGKDMKHSSLEKIPGIGPAKAKKLLLQFKTLAALRAASVDEISAVPGVTKENAAAILEFLQDK